MDIIVYLVGNFADTPVEQRAVTKSDGVDMMHSLELHNHMETSALDSSNVKELFETLIKHLFLINKNKLSYFKDKEALSQSLTGSRISKVSGQTD